MSGFCKSAHLDAPIAYPMQPHNRIRTDEADSSTDKLVDPSIPSPGGDRFVDLPDDLLITILAKVSAGASSPADLANARMTVSRFRNIAKNSEVLKNASASCIAVSAKNWSLDAQLFLKSCADAGNDGAAYLLGMQNLMSTGPMLDPLPGSFRAQPNFNNNPPQDINQNIVQQLSMIFESAKQMMSNMFERLDSAVSTLQKTSESMMHLASMMIEREEASKKRREDRKRNELGLCGGMKHGADMYVDEPAQSQTEILFDKQKRTVKEMAFWLQNKATPVELNPPWIEFSDNPRIAVDGHYIKSFLKNEVDVDQSMGFAIARLLNKGLGKQEADSGVTCVFLLHDWAAKALQGNSTAEDCIPLFDRHGIKKNKLAHCNKIVPFVLLGGNWLSVSIDIVGRSTTLIHPTAASVPANLVEEQYREMCHRLTQVALSNLSALTMKHIKHEDWSYRVALRAEHTFLPNNGGLLTFYYSIPRENQFMVVSDSPLRIVKMNFVHELIKMCSRTTNKTVRRCGIRNTTNNNKRPKVDEHGEGRALKRSCKKNKHRAQSECSEAGSCTKTISG